MTVDIRGVAIGMDHDPILAEGSCSADGMALLADGRFHDALAPLRLALAQGDTRPSTVLNLAIAEDRSGSVAYARRLMRHVADRLPDWDEPVVRLAESMRAAGDNAAAEEAYRQALELNPGRPESLIALSGLLLMRKEVEEARELLLCCCGTEPHNAEAWNTLGVALRMGGEPGLALTAIVRAQGLRPDCPEYVLHGVAVAEEAKEADAEIARLTVASDLNPLNLALQIGRGVLLERLGRRAEAIDVLEAATKLAPEELLPLRLHGAALTRAANRNKEAEAVLRRILETVPDDLVVKNDLAVVLMRLQRNAEARVILREVLDRCGRQIMPLCNLVNATAHVGLQDEAITLAQKAIRLDPAAMLPRRALCNNLAYLESVTGASMLAAMRDCSSVLPRSAQPPLTNDADADRPLVVGLLSGSFQIHPVGWLTVAGIENLDRGQFRVICLAESTAQDPIARRFRIACTEWVEVDCMTDAVLLEAARARDIDILIDLGGYGHGSRMPACANRLAPVQIKWVGSQSHSSGLAEMDWFLTDRWETPGGFEPFYSEKLLRLPDGYVCYSPPPNAPDVVALPALANGFVTFGCFNNLAKITPRVIETWAAILHRVPTARLVLKTHQFSDLPTADRLLAAFAAFGTASDRIELRGSSGHRAFMAQYGHIDIVLDPFPYSGGLTTCEALWMGVPTITIPGEIFASRHSASHLSNAGLADWVTGSVEEYIEMAVARASELTALARLRAGLREQVRLSPLCDAPRFGRNLGIALRHTWQMWCAERFQPSP
jgi:predicted O-linked N-acetylglucosamine transferase (SPINDLY family)